VYVTRYVIFGILAARICVFPNAARATPNCSNLPTQFTGNEFPTGDFFSNFDNSCYTIHLGESNGTNGDYGDMNGRYYKIFFKVDPRYQLIILGAFPNSRYFSLVLYDAHKALSQSLLDENIVPLTSQYINPYLPGKAFANGQQYAGVVGFGGTPGTLETGCMMNGYNVAVNTLDATVRHPGINWNTDAGLFQTYPTFPAHVVDTPQHSNPNTAGILMIRSYMDITPSNYDTNPHIIVRDMASGCAYPAAYALDTLQLVTTDNSIGDGWLDETQIEHHHYYENQYLPELCFGVDTQNQLGWTRGNEYVAAGDVDSGYIGSKSISAGLTTNLAAAGRVLRIRLRMPTTPPTPCTNGCSRSGTEQLRYRSLSFEATGGVTLTSLADNAFTKDPNGYATLIVGTGAAIPPWITAANGYTFLDLTTFAAYQQLTAIDLRDILPASTFNCSGEVVPYRTSVASPAGGLMGDYLPVVDYPIASTLPQTAVPLVGPNSCAVFPSGSPGVSPSCGVLPFAPIQIASATTYCTAPGCGSQFTVQPAPPLVITGSGFGSFPQGLPFVGNSNYLEITDTTQNWSAGFTGNACNVSIDNWDDSSISMLFNVNTNGSCPMAAGDLITIKVWNPQSMAAATFTTSATGN
jgi:hypothetical protein